MNILVSGASGLIGSALVPELEAAGHTVRRLVRREQNSSLEVPWRTDMLHPAAVEPFEAVIHLAGRNVGTRWTAKAKQEIRESRLQGTRTIAEAVAEAYRHVSKPGILISVSGVGYYGSRGDEVLTESSAMGTGYLAELARDWESATEPASAAGVRVVIPRVGVVLTRRGGALSKMILPFQLGLGGPIGGGGQWIPWIVLEDLLRLMKAALTDDRMHGPINAVAPQPAANGDFVRALAKALQRPAVVPMPAFVVKTLLGQMGEETLLASERAVPTKLQELGFNFLHPEIGEAMHFAVRN